MFPCRISPTPISPLWCAVIFFAFRISYDTRAVLGVLLALVLRRGALPLTFVGTARADYDSGRIAAHVLICGLFQAGQTGRFCPDACALYVSGNR